VRVCVIGIGNEYRGDDAVGRLVVWRLKSQPDVRIIEESGEGAALMEAWKGADAAILVDAIQSGEAPGTVHRLDASAGAIPSRFFHYSTHAFSLAEAVELARALGELPSRTIIYGIEGRSFAAGSALSPEVAAAVELVAARIRSEVAEIRSG
jgi:hydrogenase maturation protease